MAKKESGFFEVLLSNNKSELKKWILKHGKSQKPISPIIFFNKEEYDNISKERRGKENG